MTHEKNIFSQYMDMINREDFDKNARKRLADKGSKGFSNWDLLVSMMYLQLAQAKSLRGIEYGLKGCLDKLKHLGIKRSTLSYASAHRPWQLFRYTFYQMLDLCQRVNSNSKRKFRFNNKFFSLDATSIEMALTVFDWAKYRRAKGTLKRENLPPDSKEHILEDKIIRLSDGNEYRLVTVFDEDNEMYLELLTNIRKFAASTISDIYKDRWQIEVSFRYLKQNPKIKTFVGTSSNAVLIQVWTALIAMLIFYYMRFKSSFGWLLSNLRRQSRKITSPI